ncbi:SRPBCC family protein [Actinoallomurus rhizosphaericola]|uniref:SRPBCC family protein n=1 Tax=Actinoallomurus rhizosphaericola TaxID=2952536 RepID=UPI0020936574|nr:SRPBCC family protein [Actinoallomurus rhizosphaericola]MCO5996317.1 SRPBCC family protein [Actinoallomurus rhizosphaericola]
MAKTEITAEPGIPQIIITREFEAPRDLVFRAYTDPELIVRWLGPRDLTTRFEYHEPRDGGRWRYVSTDPAGNEHGFRGVFHGTPSVDGGIVQTFEYEGVPGHVALETVTFEETGGRTLVRSVSGFQSVEDRDGMVASGAEYGVRESDERLTALLAELQSR